MSTEEKAANVSMDNRRGSEPTLWQTAEPTSIDVLDEIFEQSWPDGDLATIRYDQLAPARSTANESPVKPSESTESPSVSNWPAGMGRLVELPRLNAIELTELLEDLALSLQTNAGYREARAELTATIPPLPTGPSDERLLVRETDEGRGIVRLSYWHYKSRTPRLGIYGAMMTPDDEL